jgi:hypothetical protein
MSSEPERKSLSSLESRGRSSPAGDVPGPVCGVLRDKDQQRLDRQFDRLNENLPRAVGQKMVWLRKPSSRWVRLPIGMLLIVASAFSFLPVLGLWMLPLGLMLLAVDVPLLRRPTGLALVWVERQWRRAAGWYRSRTEQGGHSDPTAEKQDRLNSRQSPKSATLRNGSCSGEQ